MIAFINSLDNTSFHKTRGNFFISSFVIEFNKLNFNMRATTLFYLISVFILTLSCRPKEELIPLKEIIDVKNPSKINFLKAIKIDGALDVILDDSLGTIQVKLPADYSSTSISVRLTFYPEVYLRQVIGFTGTPFKPDSSTKTSFKVKYAGDFPVEFITQILSSFNNKSYKIYVEHLGKPMVKISYAYHDVSTYFSANFGLDAVSGIGTIPSNPQNSIRYLGLLRKTNTTDSDTCVMTGLSAYFKGKLEKYVPLENQLFTFEIIKENQREIVKDDISFIRQNLFLHERGRFRTVDSKTFSMYAYSNYFSLLDKYTIKLSNDFNSTIYEVNGEVDKKDYKKLSIKFPTSFPKGSYLFDLYENERKISDKGMVSVSDNPSEKSILKLWKKRGGYEYYDYFVETFETVKMEFFKGDTLNVMPLPTLLYSTNLQKENIPSLKLIVNNKAIELKPTPIRISFPIAITSFHGFYYVLPKELESGSYEVQLIYPNGEESLKYWNKIGIK